MGHLGCTYCNHRTCYYSHSSNVELKHREMRLFFQSHTVRMHLCEAANPGFSGSASWIPSIKTTDRIQKSRSALPAVMATVVDRM